MYETRPDVVVETGTRLGGSSAYFASILDLLGKGRVITVDIVDYPDKPQHDRITYLTGSSTSLEIIERIREPQFRSSNGNPSLEVISGRLHPGKFSFQFLKPECPGSPV